MTLPELDLLPLVTLPVAPAEAGVELCDQAGGRLPLTAVDIDAHVCGLDVRLFVRHLFTNASATPIEATYVFPLPPRAAVRAFTATFAGRVVRARIDERSAARREYQAAIAEGRAAALAEEDRPSTFTMTVGNIPPGAEVRCELECDAAVAVDAHPDREGFEAQLRLPTVVAPRYTEGVPLDGRPAGTGIAPDTDAVPDASRVSPPLVAPGGPVADQASFSCQVTVDPAGLEASELACTVPASVTRGSLVSGDGPCTLTIASGARLDRDVVFTWRLAPAAVATSAVVAPDAEAIGQPGDATWEVTILPPATAPGAARGRDVVVLLDRSGSMGGWKMAAARRAAARIIDSLGACDRFALAAFDDQIAVFRPGWVVATDQHRFEASAWAAGVDDQGGTELSAALLHAAALFGPVAPAVPTGASERDRLLVLVTDAQVTGEDRAVETVARDLAGVRVFALGVDTAVNLGLLERLARTSGGTAQVIDNAGRVEEILTRLVRAVGAPVLTHLAVTVPGADAASQAPRVLPDLFPGCPVTVAGRLEADGTTPIELALVGRLADGTPWSHGVSAVTATGPAAATITGRWARTRVLDLEDAWIAGAGATPDEIVALSKGCSVLSRFTAFIAVDQDGQLVAAPAVPVHQPVEPPSGWAVRLRAGPAAADQLLMRPHLMDPLLAESFQTLGRPYPGARSMTLWSGTPLDEPAYPRPELLPDDVDEVTRLCTQVDQLPSEPDHDAVAALLATAHVLQVRHGALLGDLVRALELLLADPSDARRADAKRAARKLRLDLMFPR